MVVVVAVGIGSEEGRGKCNARCCADVATALCLLSLSLYLAQELLLRGLAASIEPLEGSSLSPYPRNPPIPPSWNRQVTNQSSSSRSSSSSVGSSTRSKKVFILEPTTVSAQAFVVFRVSPRPPPLVPGMAGGVSSVGCSGGGGGSGSGGGGTSTVRAVSISGEAWRTMRSSLLQNLPNLMRTWAQVCGEVL